MTTRTPLWDLPTRLFHWALVLLLPLAWWTAEEGEMERHQWVGYTLLVLVLFRIAWGVVGSRHSRFADFVHGPTRVLAYTRGEAPAGAGHNPLGGWSVLVILTLLLLQAVSGLFNSDDVLFDGPLHYWAGTDLRGLMGEVHELAFNGLLAMVALHLVAVLFYQVRLRQPLLQAMWRGSADGREGQAPPVPLWRALLLVVLASLALWGLIQAAPRPALPW
jgi:cytochrome b